MTTQPRHALVIEDEAVWLSWITTFLTNRGYTITSNTNQLDARETIIAYDKTRHPPFTLAIVDVMMATLSRDRLMEMADKGEDNHPLIGKDAKNSGIILCQLIREELKIPKQELLVVCLTVREDNDITKEMKRLGIPLLNKADMDTEQRLNKLLDSYERRF